MWDLYKEGKKVSFKVKTKIKQVSLIVLSQSHSHKHPKIVVFSKFFQLLGTRAGVCLQVSIQPLGSAMIVSSC